MRYTKSGESDLSVSRICLDCSDLYICHMWDNQTPLYTMTEIFLAWLLTKVTAPAVSSTTSRVRPGLWS